jgi:hypothetical protein
VSGDADEAPRGGEDNMSGREKEKKRSVEEGEISSGHEMKI